MSADPWTRQDSHYRNTLIHSLGGLVGIAQGMLSDQHLADDEIRFLDAWLESHHQIAFDWPGDIIHQRVKHILADSVVTEAERAYLVDVLQLLIGGSPGDIAQATYVTELAFDDVEAIEFEGCLFCLTGNFVYAPREACEAAVESRGGLIRKGVSGKVRYVIVGSLGSPEWKHGSFGTKIAKAMELKRGGAPILVVREDAWSAAL